MYIVLISIQIKSAKKFLDDTYEATFKNSIFYSPMSFAKDEDKALKSLDN